MNYKIEKDKCLGKYIVWEIHKNLKIQRYHGYKYQCKEWINKKEK